MKKVVTVCFSILLATYCMIGCEPMQSTGQFYSMDEAYDNGWLTTEDLRSIAYYYHARYGGSYDEEYVPIPREPSQLSSDTEREIKVTYFVTILEKKKGTFKKIELYAYYGTYGDCIAVGITDSYFVRDLLTYPEYTIGEIKFCLFSTSDIRIWQKSK